MSIWKSTIRTLAAAAPFALATTSFAGAPVAADNFTPMSSPVSMLADQPGTAPAAAPATAQPETKSDTKAPDAKSSHTRAAVITFGDEANGHMVGIYCTADSFRRALKFLEDEKVNTVIVRFHSGGGALIEIQKLSDIFEKEYKSKFRLVAWIDSAISAAAMSAHCFEEIYFTPQGNYGACTGFSGNGVAVKGRDLEEVLYMMEGISDRGGYDKLIMRAMQISSAPEECAPLGIGSKTGALSATINPTTGEVKYFNDSSGEIVLNPRGGVNILTFNANDALKVKFSKGTAGTLDELAKAMSLTEVEWIGRKDPRFVYPVCKAEEFMINFRKKTKDDETNLNRYFNNYGNAAGAAAQSNDIETASKFLGKARQALEQIKSVVRNNPNLMLLNVFGSEERYKQWIEEQEKTLKEIATRLKR